MQSSIVQTDQQTIDQASQTLKAGGLVVFPTETVYGIAASTASPKGIEALREFKGRPESQPFSIHLPSPDAALPYLNGADPAVRRLVRKVFPGPVTLIVEVSDSAITDHLKALGLPSETRDSLVHNNTIGLRCPDSVLTQRVLAAVDAPVIASSANRHGQPPPHNAQEATESVGSAAQMVIDGGPCRFAKPSTIVRVSGQPDGCGITIERAGVYDERFIRKLLRWTMVLVCSGNTCRSPMAQALAKQMIAKRRNIPADVLESANVSVLSAGVYASPGMPASIEAVDEMKKLGIDLSEHRSQPLTPELIHEADVIYCMTHTHLDAVLRASPGAGDKIFLLDPQGHDVNDPIGAGEAAYRQCAEMISGMLTQRIEEQKP